MLTKEIEVNYIGVTDIEKAYAVYVEGDPDLQVEVNHDNFYPTVTITQGKCTYIFHSVTMLRFFTNDTLTEKREYYSPLSNKEIK